MTSVQACSFVETRTSVQNIDIMSEASAASGLTLIELLAQFLKQCNLEESSAILLEEAGRLNYPWVRLSQPTAKTIHDALIHNCLDDAVSDESGSFKTDEFDGADETEISDASSSESAEENQPNDDNPKVWDATPPVPWLAAVDAVDREIANQSVVDISAVSDEYDDDNDCGYCGCFFTIV